MFLSRLASFVETHDAHLITTWFKPDSEVSGDAIITLFINSILESSILLKRPFTPGPLTIVTKALFDTVGGYDETRTYGEDYDFGYKVYKRGIPLHILRETLCVYSLRRFRSRGRLNMLQAYAKGVFAVLVTKNMPKSMAGYIMGGHPYKKSRKIKRSAFKKFQMDLRQLVKELLE